MSQTRKPRSWPERLFSIETLFGLVGLGLLVRGALLGVAMGVFWGVMILVGLGLLYLVRKKDWKKHWEDMERERNRQGR